MLLPVLRDLSDSHFAGPGALHLKAILDTPKRAGAQRAIKPYPGSNEFKLTQRELEILRFMATGLQYKEIAARTFLSVETVRTHAKHILEKLDAASRLEAVRRAEGMGLLDDL
jgi:LuxR family maltose regulon positive regulatory protein